MDAPLDRPCYAASGRVRWLCFVPLSVFALFVGVVMAGVLSQAGRWGLYILVLAPLLAALPAVGAVALAARAGHCRSRFLAAFLGVMVGVILYVGHFQFDLCRLMGREHLKRVDLLPQYIWARVQTDRFRKVGHNDQKVARANNIVDMCFVGVFYAMELSLVVAMAAGAGWAVTRRPYAEEFGRWMHQVNCHCPPEAAPALMEALARRDSTAFQTALVPGDPGQMHTELTIDYLPGEPDTPVYLTITVVGPPADSNTRARHERVRRVLLERSEALAIAGMFTIPDASFADTKVPPPPPTDVMTRGRVVALDDEEAGPRVLSTSNKVWGSVLTLLPGILGMGGFFGLLGGALWLGEDTLGWQGLVAAAVAGFFCLIGALVYLIRYSDYLGSRLYLSRSLAAVRSRPDALVDPDDPEAIYIQVVPRANWGKMMLETASEVGFFKVDEKKGAIVYEGDRERWAIPEEAILSCNVEDFPMNNNQPEAGRYRVVVLRANVDGRVWEAPLAPRHIHFKRRTPSDQAAEVDALQARIAAILPPPE